MTGTLTVFMSFKLGTLLRIYLKEIFHKNNRAMCIKMFSTNIPIITECWEEIFVQLLFNICKSNIIKHLWELFKYVRGKEQNTKFLTSWEYNLFKMYSNDWH